MSEVATIEPKTGGALTPMEMLNNAVQAGADPDVLGKLMDLQERYQNRNAKAAYDAAMAEMQNELPVIEKTRPGHTSKYASWGDIKEQIQATLYKFGFAITHRTKVLDNQVIVTAICSHRDGHREETDLPLPFDKSGSKNDVQARGSSIEYGKRYTGCAILGIATKDEADPDKVRDGGDDYDATPWLDKIRMAKLKPDLSKIGEALKQDKTVPPSVMKTLRTAWSARMRAITEGGDNGTAR